MSKLTKKWHSKTSKLLNIFKSNFKSLFLKTKKPYIITPLIIGTLTLVSFVGYKFIQAAAIPEVSISGTNTPLIGETFSTQISFNNAGNDAGFGPFIDVILPRNGSDGVFPYNPGFEADGITFNSATIDSISSTPVLSTTFPDDGAGTGCVNHPLAVDSSNSPRSVCGTAGDIYLVFILPFGSYVSDQPTSTLNLSLAISNLADISTPLDIIATGGFRFGADSLNNPSTDPSIYTPYDVSLPQPSEWATHSVSPSLVTVNNFDNPPENEIPSGPNSPQTYTSQIQVASGQTIGESGNPSNNVIFTNTLSDKVTYLGSASLPTGCSVTTTPTLPADNIFEVTCDSLGAGSHSISFQYFVDYEDNSSNPVISPTTGDEVLFTNDISLSAAWIPIDTRDSTEIFNLDITPIDDTSIAKSIVIRKSGNIVTNSGSAGLSPGDVIEYTLDFSLSDFFGFDDIVVTDVLSDGLRIDETFTPTLNITENNLTENITFGGGNLTIQDNFTGGSPEILPLDGTQTYIFDISNQLIESSYSLDGILLGGCIPQIGTGGNMNCDTFNGGSTNGTVTFRAVVQENFTDVVGNQNVGLGDNVSNNVTIEGNLITTSDASSLTGFNQADISSWIGTIDFFGLTKEVYAINGNSSFTEYQISPGDDVTYKISLPISSSDFESLVLEDYFPLPVFDVANPNSDGTANGLSEWSFDTNASNNPPAPGVIQLSNDDTFFSISQGVLGPLGLQPTLSIDLNSNKLTMNYGDFDDPISSESVIDLLITVTVSNNQFADGLFITNQVTSAIDNTFGTSFATSATTQIELKMPDVKISKGAIISNNPNSTFVDDDMVLISNPVPTGVVFSAPGGSCSRFSSGGSITSSKIETNPITANFDNIDSDDILSFAVIAENIGGAPQGAFDVTIKDILPAEYTYQTGTLCITDGNGNILSWSAVNGSNTNPLFEDGIRLDNPLSTYDENSGTNLAVIVYDVMMNSTVEPEQTFENTTELIRFSGDASGPNYINVETIDNSQATISSPEINKNILGTNLASTSGNTAVEGEILTYQVELTIPEGTMQNAILEDTLDNGLIFQECSSIETFSDGVPTSDITSNGSNDFNTNICNDPTNPTVSPNARNINFNFGTLVNNNTDNTKNETIVVIYTVVVSNENTVKGSDKNNAASFRWGPISGSPINTITDAAPNVRIHYPDFVLTKALSPNTADAGDIIGVTLTLRQDNGANETTGYDIQATDILPAGLTFAGNLACSNDTGNQTSCSESSGTITAQYSSMAPNTTETITFNVTVDNSVSIGQVITNTLSVSYSSLPGDPGQQSIYSPDSTEEVYTQTTNANLTIFTPVPDKSISATSESHTSTNSGGVQQLAIGEIVRYRLVTRVAETTSTNVQFLDLIPNGVQFLNDGTAKVAFVSNNTGITSSTLIPANIACDGGANPNLNLFGNASNLNTLSPECPLPDDAVSSNATSNVDNYGYAGGDDVYFKLGDIINSDNDSDEEYIIIEFNALLLNVSGNTEGLTLNNQFRIIVNGTNITTSTNLAKNRIQVLSSQINTDKILTETPEEAGDTVTYRITMTNPSGTNKSTAFDNTFTDTVSGKIENISTSIISNPGYAILTDNSSGNNIEFTINELRPGDSVIVEVTGNTTDTIEAQETVTNNAQTISTSLPGNGTTGNPTESNTPGLDPSNRDIERTSTTSDTASFSTISPTVDLKTLSDTTYNIGDTVTYNVLVNLNQGVTKGLKVFLDLPTGMQYQGYNLLTTDLSSTLLTDDFSGSIGSPTVTSSGSSGEEVEFNFGDVTIPSNLSETDESVVVQITAILLNEIGNQKGDSLSSTTRLQFTEPDIPSTVNVNDTDGGANLTIVEPILEVSKSIISSQPSYDGGDIVTYQIELSHHTNSDADAFDVNINDFLPAEFDSINVIGVNATGFTAPNTSTTSDPNLIINTFDFPLGATLEATYEATLDSEIAPIKNVVNNVTVKWESLNGGGTNSRSGDDDNNYDLTESGASGLDDYQAKTSESFTSAGPTHELNLIGSSDYTIGETITYELIATLPEGIIQNVSLKDLLPTGLIYQNATVDTTGFNGTATSSPTITGGSSSGEDVNIDFGNVTVNADGDGSNNTFKVVLTAKVVNELGNQRGDTLTNSSELIFTNPNTLLDETINASNAPQISIIESILDITKLATNFPTIVNKDSQITYTINVSHNSLSDANAYDISLTDFLTDQFESIESVTIIPTGITAPSYQISNDKDLLIPNSTDGTFDLPLGASLSIELVTNVDEFINPDITLENNVNITWSSLNGNVSGERNGTDGTYDISETGTTNLNDYSINSLDNSVTTDSNKITKFFVSSNNTFTPETPDIKVAVGEQVIFFIRAHLEEGTTNSYVIRDSIPENLTVDNVELITNSADSFGYMSQNFGGGTITPSISTIAGDRNDIEVTLTNILNPTDGNGPNNFIGLKVIATVKDIPSNIDSVSFQSQATGQKDSDPIQDAGTITMSIIEPNIEITHSISETEATPNQEINLSYTVTNTGTSGGHDLELINTFEELTPDSLIYTTNSAELICTAGVTETTNLTESADSLEISIEHLPINESCTVTFKASVKNTVFKGTIIANKSIVTKATSMPGNSHSEERDETSDGEIESEDSFIVIKPDLKLTEQVNKDTFNTQELVTYTIKTENIGTAGAINPTINKTVPNNTTFSPTQSTPGWTCTNGGVAGSTCTYINSQELAPTKNFEINFGVIIDKNLPAGTDSLKSDSSVSDNQARGFDETENNQTTVSVTVLGQPDLQIKVDDGGLQAFTDDKVNYKITYQNIGTKGSTGVVIRTKIPEFSEYFPNTSTSGWICTDNKHPGECIFEVGSLPVEETEKEIVLTLKVIGYAPTDLETLSLSVSIEDDKKNGDDINLSNNTASDITPLLYTSVFDPPSSLKTFNAGGLPEFEWKMVWLNDGNTDALNVLLTDDVPEGTTYVQDSFKCDARGDSTTTRCDFNPELNRVEWEGMIAPDPGKLDEDDGLNEVVLIFRTTVPEEIQKLTNQAKAHWDENGNGTFEDDILYGQIASLSNDPRTMEGNDSTVWERQPKVSETLDQAGNGIQVRVIIALVTSFALILTFMIEKFLPIKHLKDEI